MKNKKLNIIEIMKFPVGTTFKSVMYSEDIFLEIVKDEDNIKFLSLIGGKRIAFVSDEIVQAKFCIIKKGEIR